MRKACKFTQELLNLFTPARTGEQLVHIDVKRFLSKGQDLFLLENDNYTKT